MINLLSDSSVNFIKNLPPTALNNWALSVYKSGFKDGIEKAEEDFDNEAQILTCDKVIEKLTNSGFSIDEANYILEVLIND